MHGGEKGNWHIIKRTLHYKKKGSFFIFSIVIEINLEVI